MSAYMVHEEHINVMIWAAVELGSPSHTGPVFRYLDNEGQVHTLSALDPDSLARAGQVLVDANAESMAARYGEHDHGYHYLYRRMSTRPAKRGSSTAPRPETSVRPCAAG